MTDYMAPICIGTGLVALDVVISDNPQKPTQFMVGGSCGNVLTILSYLGWQSYPIARLSNNAACEYLVSDLLNWGVNLNFLSITESGSTPIIIHRILKDSKGIPKHRFEFRNPEDGKYLPAYKPYLSKYVDLITTQRYKADIFFFDRSNRASLDLAAYYKAQGSVIFYEPSSYKDLKGFNESISITDIVKFSNERISDYDELYPVAIAKLEIQTLGTDGLKFRRRGERLWTKVEGYSINNVVDSAGAGDWCTAGIIYTLFGNNNNLDTIDNSTIIYALSFGQILSALNCTFEGARGMMYFIHSQELLTYVGKFLKTTSSIINHSPERKDKPSFIKPSVKISSLLSVA